MKTKLNDSIPQVKLSYSYKQKASELIKVTDSRESYNVLKGCFDADTIDYRESIKCLLLNRSNKVLGVASICEGGISDAPVDIRIILQAALLSNASGIILSHNHPSGNLSPSLDDDKITKKIKEACQVVNISFLDHIIITSESYYSYADDGRI